MAWPHTRPGRTQQQALAIAVVIVLGNILYQAPGTPPGRQEAYLNEGSSGPLRAARVATAHHNGHHDHAFITTSSTRGLLQDTEEGIALGYASQCSSASGLSGQLRDRCALWHQVVLGLGHKEGPFSRNCVDFVRTVDICHPHDPIPLNITCEELGRVVMLKSSMGPDMESTKSTGRHLSPAVAAMDALIHFDLQGMSLSGTLPSGWGKMAQLRDLVLSHNHLEGQLPGEWSELVNLTILELDNNNLSGPLPLEWGRMAQLSVLNLDNNHLEGQLPGEWSELANLEMLYLRNNSLSGTLPSEWGRMARLSILYLDNNHLEGQLPGEWSILANLEMLFLSNNSLSGTLPSEWGRMARLGVLAMFNNSLSGTVPSEWGAMTQLSAVYLQVNSPMNGLLPVQVLEAPSSPTVWSHKMKIFVDEDFLVKEMRPFLMRETYIKVINATHTGLTLPPFLKLHRICQQYKGKERVLYIEYGNGETFWCGRTLHAELQVALLWIFFGAALLIIFVVQKRKAGRGRPTTRRPPGTITTTTRPQGTSTAILGLAPADPIEEDSSPEALTTTNKPRPSRWRCTSTCQGALAFWKKHLYVPVRLTLCLVDLFTDIWLAVSMYPSWTFYMVAVGFFLPDLVVSLALAVGSGEPLRRRGLPIWVVGPAMPVLFTLIAATLPVLLVIMSLLDVLLSRRKVSGLSRLLHVDRVLSLFSGVTACTEDVFVSVFSCVALLLMNCNPISTVTTRIYFPVWAFWISVPFSMLHMALAWRDGLERLLQHGRDLSWVGSAFTNLYVCEEC